MNGVINIAGLTLLVTVTSTFVSTVLGVPAGYFLASTKSKYKNMLQSIANALTGLPPVVAGLLIYFLLTRDGPLGSFGLLYSPPAIVIAQILIVTPIIAAFSYPAFLKTGLQMNETFAGLQITGRLRFLILLKECKTALISAVMAGFGRAVSEVGAVMIVGGNIEGRTRVMTTAIITQTGQGNYNDAIALGGILLILSITINLLIGCLRRKI